MGWWSPSVRNKLTFFCYSSIITWAIGVWLCNMKLSDRLYYRSTSDFPISVAWPRNKLEVQNSQFLHNIYVLSNFCEIRIIISCQSFLQSLRGRFFDFGSSDPEIRSMIKTWKFFTAFIYSQPSSFEPCTSFPLKVLNYISVRNNRESSPWVFLVRLACSLLVASLNRSPGNIFRGKDRKP